jgi:hypothetical protein
MVPMPGSSAVYAIYLIAFARLVVFLTSDTLINEPRDAFITALKERGRHKLAYLFLCPWCLSIWLGIPAAPVIYAYGHHWWLFVPALWLALSAAAGALARVKG